MEKSVFRTISLVAFIALAACARSNSNDSQLTPPKSQQEDQKPIADTTLELSYDLQGYEQCSTGPHTVSEATHEEFVAKFCALVQSGKENKGCAESQRLELFVVHCPGAWTPTETADNLKKKKRGESRVVDRREHEMSLTLQNLKVVAPTAPVDIQTQKIYARLNQCGLTPACLLSTEITGGIPAMSLTWSSIEWQPENQIALIGAINPTAVATKADPTSPVTYVVVRFPKNSTTTAPRLEVWTGLYPIGFRSFREFFSHSVSSHLVTTLQTQYN